MSERNGYRSGSNLERVLRSGAFAVTAELGPPKNADAEVIRISLDKVLTSQFLIANGFQPDFPAEVQLDRVRAHARLQCPRIHSVAHSVTKARTTVTAARVIARSSRPACVLWKIASESVCVRPGMLPATMIVAPNSPSARAVERTTP